MDPTKPDTNQQKQYWAPAPPESQLPATGIPVHSAPQYPSNYPQPPSGARVAWSTGLFDCFADVNLLHKILVSMYNFWPDSRNHRPWINILREQYMLEQSPCWDWLVHCCCETCALCQEYRELQYRGYNMVLGWTGNLQQQNRGWLWLQQLQHLNKG